MQRTASTSSTVRKLLTTSSASLLVAAAATAGEEGLFPIFLVDPGTDQVYRGIDGDGDRSYNTAGEMIVFYDDTVGSLALDEPTTLHTSPDDFLFIGDSALDRILTMDADNLAQVRVLVSQLGPSPDLARIEPMGEEEE